MPGKATLLAKTVPSIVEAEEFLAQLWASLEKHNLATPAIRLSFGCGVTILAEFEDVATASLVADEMEDAVV